VVGILNITIETKVNGDYRNFTTVLSGARDEYSEPSGKPELPEQGFPKLELGK
jgi:hypothetical protein